MCKGSYIPVCGNQLREQRKRLGLSQGKLAEMIGVTRQTIGLIEQGKYNPSNVIIAKLLVVTSATYEELFPGYANVEVTW